MRAVGVSTFGGPEALAVHDVPEPHAGAGEVRIRVRAAAVSPVDAGVRSGRFDVGELPPPYIPGRDAAGVIDEVGVGTSWQVGDEVMASALPFTRHGGAYVEYLVAPDDSIARIPAGTSFEEASTLPMNGMTATQVLELMDLQPGQIVAVTGSAGTLGGYLVQLAKRAGLTVIADAGPQDVPLVTSLGPDHIVERGDDVADRIRVIAPEGVDGLADAAGLQERVVPALRDGGVFVSMRGWKGEPTRGIRYEAAVSSKEYHSRAKLDALRQAVEDGALTPRVAGVFPAEDAAEAHRRLEAGGTRGRFVLTF